MAFPSYTASSQRELDALNKLLFAVGLAPVASLDVHPQSDANMAITQLRLTFREYAARGWYCFNRSDAQELTPDLNGEIVLTTPAYKVETNPTARSFNPTLPHVRLDVAANKLFVFHKGAKVTNLKTLLPTPTLFVDVVWQHGFEDAPQEFIDYVVAKTAERFGALVGVPQTPAAVEESFGALMSLESEATPPANVFTDNPTLYTWNR